MDDHLPLDRSNTTEKTNGEVQIKLLCSVHLHLYIDKYRCSVRYEFGNDTQYTLFVVQG